MFFSENQRFPEISSPILHLNPTAMVLERLFGWTRRQEQDPDISFGRYSDNNKTVDQVNAWTEADTIFKAGDYHGSIEKVFEYMSDPLDKNIWYEPSEGGFPFLLYQGSKLVRGQFNGEKFKAEVKLAKCARPTVAIMRKLLEMNFHLYYTRYSLAEDMIFLRFDCDTSSASPNRLYYGLKELATKADKQDDLLLSEFDILQPVDTEHIISIPESECEIKYNYLKKWIEDTLRQIQDLDADKFSGAISYLLLTLVFRIDYLITPEGKLLQDLEKIGSSYYGKDDKSAPERNPMMIEKFKKILSRSKDSLFAQLFRSKHTFAIVPPTSHKTLSDAIETSMTNMEWYRNNNHPGIANKVLEYGIAYCQYSYSLPRPVSSLFRLFMNINYEEYFSDLGFELRFFDEAKNEFRRDEIGERIESIVREWKLKYPSLEFDIRKLNYDTLLAFNESFLKEIARMNFD
jgi:hypothetical protein